MITSMSDYENLIVITNRHLCHKDYLNQIQKVVSLHPKALILREKDLPEDEYKVLAEKVVKICEKESVPFFVHSFLTVANEIGISNIHLSVQGLRESKMQLESFQQISVSCHSMEDVMEAISAGATQIILGNIFETDCKKGLPGKGLEFLRQICESSSIPVYAIGGINKDNLMSVMNAGAKGGCMMSGFMTLEL